MKNNRIIPATNLISRVGYALRTICKSSSKAKIKKVRNSQPIQTSRVGNVFLPTIDDEIFLLPQVVGKKACPPYSTMQRPPINHLALFRSPPAHQSGAVLIVSLIMLLLLTLIGVTSMQTTMLEEKMAGNMRDKDLAFQVAESALKAAEASLVEMPVTTLTANFTGSNADNGTSGYYSTTPTPDLSESEIVKDSFWTTNPVATSTVTGLGNGIATPKYIIQKMGVADCPGAAIGSSGCINYRITARATGGSTNAVVILESIYSR